MVGKGIETSGNVSKSKAMQVSSEQIFKKQSNVWKRNEKYWEVGTCRKMHGKVRKSKETLGSKER